MSVPPVTIFRLGPANGHLVLAHVSGKMRKLFSRPTMPEPIRQATKRTYRLWKENPRASALRFKKVRDVYSVRIGTTGYRAIAADVFLDNWFA
jgi:hypothetical protein